MNDVSIKQKMSPDEENLLKLLAKKGEGGANNGSLMSELKWKDDRFWAARNALLDRGLVRKAHGGPGGKTIIETLEQGEEASTIGLSVQPPITSVKNEDESLLYEPILKQIEENWAKDARYNVFFAFITARQGRRDTGGTWSRPDLCLLGVQKFKFLREPTFDMVTFEVKANWDVSVKAIFEALSHRQSATKSYVVYHINLADFEAQPEKERIIALAEQHGVGVILAEDPTKFSTWSEKVRGRRWEPDPESLNDFIQVVIPPEEHDKILTMLK